MTEENTKRDSEIQAILLEAVEVQLAAVKAGINFWTEWINEATRFSEEAIRRLNELQSEPSENGRILLELTDVSRESLRSFNQLPRHAAETFIRELDSFEATRNPVKKSGVKPKAKRAVRVKP